MPEAFARCFFVLIVSSTACSSTTSVGPTTDGESTTTLAPTIDADDNGKAVWKLSTTLPGLMTVRYESKEAASYLGIAAMLGQAALMAPGTTVEVNDGPSLVKWTLQSSLSAMWVMQDELVERFQGAFEGALPEALAGDSLRRRLW